MDFGVDLVCDVVLHGTEGCCVVGFVVGAVVAVVPASTPVYVVCTSGQERITCCAGGREPRHARHGMWVLVLRVPGQ